MSATASPSSPVLASYVDNRGQARELLAREGARGSVLVIDRDATTLCDRRLVAHLAPDEPSENAALVCRLYLREESGRRCRPLTSEDLRCLPVEEPALSGSLEEPALSKPAEDLVPSRPAEEEPLECEGSLYRIGPCPQRGSTIAQLRWSRRASRPGRRRWEPVSLREAVERFESYEPMRTMTVRALACHAQDPAVSIVVLRAELCRMQCSAVVLNRGLREAVLRAVDRRELSMSEIAMRCGMVKRDRHGRPSGETSWLARRVGLMPDGGDRPPARWIHSDVLALIARHGLGVSPHEVELG